MSTAWTLTAAEICEDALEHLGVLGDGETAGGNEMQTALKALDGVLKELPLMGYNWPKLSSEVALTWVSGQTIALPADYYAYPVAWRTVSGSKTRLQQLTHAQWIDMPGRSVAGDAVTHFYIGPDSLLYLYPTPSVNPVVTLQYQKIVDDADFIVSPNVLQIWINPLGYGVANELGLKFGAPADVRQEVAARWSAKRERALESSIESAPICITVDD